MDLMGVHGTRKRKKSGCLPGGQWGHLLEQGPWRRSREGWSLSVEWGTLDMSHLLNSHGRRQEGKLAAPRVLGGDTHSEASATGAK